MTSWRQRLGVWHLPAREVDAELQFHLDERVTELLAQGVDPDSARAQAAREFGDVTGVRDGLIAIDRHGAGRRRWRERAEWLGQDLRYVVRSLRRSPGFVVAVVATLALGLGANAAVFSVLDQLFFRPPAGVTHGSEVRRVYRDVPGLAAANGGRIPARAPGVVPEFDYPEIRVLRSALPESAQLGVYANGTAKIGHGANAPELAMSYVDGAYFDVLGVRATRGRFFRPEELRPEVPTAVAVLSERVWRAQFDGRADIVGQSVVIDNHLFTVVGVAGDGFLGADRAPVDLWVPMNTMDGFAATARHYYDAVYFFTMQALVRAPTPAAIEALTARAQLGLRRGPMAEDSIAVATLAPLVVPAPPGDTHAEEGVSISTRLAGVALIILLIAIANVGNLVLARTMNRRREIGVRLALGIGRGRLVRLLFLESAVLTVLAGGMALAAGWWTSGVLRRFLFPQVSSPVSPLDLRVLCFVIALVAISAICAGLVPALLATRANLLGALKSGEREGVFQRSRLRSGLLVAQAALSVLLLTGAGAFVRSLHGVETENVGYDVDRVVTATVDWDADESGDRGQDMQAGLAAAVVRLRQLPNVEQVGLTYTPLMTGASFPGLFYSNGDSVVARQGQPPLFNLVSPEFFAAAGIHVAAGRGVLASDQIGSAPVMVVSRTMANTLWPGESPIGKCLIIDTRGSACRSVVGVVTDAHYHSIIEPPSMQYYLPAAQYTIRPAYRMVVRAAPGRAELVAADVRNSLRASYGDWAIPHVHTLAETVAPQLRPWQLGAALFSGAGLLALVVAMIGIYSVISYTFGQRRQEMGIRMALGARGGQVVRMVVADGVRIVGIGIVIGVGLAIASGRSISAMLYHSSSHDPVVLGAVILLLLAVTALASLVPAWRASRVDPVVALRAE